MPLLQSVHASELALDSFDTWNTQFEDLKGRIAARFTRYDAHAHACDYLKALLSPIERKNAWQIAEQAQVAAPYCFQHLINRGKWEAELVRDDLFGYVNDHLATEAGVLVFDETGFLKKGDKSAGVARQYSGTAGRIENAQIGVFVGYASTKGQTLIDRELYLPEGWIADPIRCVAAGVPAKTKFATKPQLALRMLKRVRKADIPFAWVCGDSVYGSDPYLRRYLESEALSYVLQVRANQTIFRNSHYWRVDALAAKVAPDAWQVHSAGTGSQGERLYEWALIECAYGGESFFGRWLLVRRSLSEPSDLP